MREKLKRAVESKSEPLWRRIGMTGRGRVCDVNMMMLHCIQHAPVKELKR